MKKIILTIFCILALLFIGWEALAAPAISIPWDSEIRDVSLGIWTSWNVAVDINNTWFQILRLIKRVLMWLLVIFIVYVGAMMIMSMWSDEEQLSSAKRQIWYSLVALIFINIPGNLYYAFQKDSSASVWERVRWWAFENASSESSWNILFDFFAFSGTVNDQIIMFLEIMIFLWAIFMLTLAGIQVMTSRGREESMKEAKNKIVYTILALIFVGIIEAWRSLAFGGVIDDGVDLFGSLLRLALFFTVPVAIFFLTLAWYYFITSNGDEERTKKAKSIILNTLLATLILLAAYTFLVDLQGII